MHLFWHRRDLRIHDNRGLHAATQDGETIPVFIYDPELLGQIGERQRAFFYRGVRALKRAYRDRGGDLIIRKGDTVTVFEELLDEYDIDRIYYNEHYRPARRNRQRSVDRAFSTSRHIDLTLVDPDTLEPRYPNHSQFYNDWEAEPKPAPVSAPADDTLAAVSDGTTVPNPKVDLSIPDAGYAAAWQRYDDFLADGIDTYNDTRDDLTMAVDAPLRATSRMSPYLAAGMIGIREVWQEATKRKRTASGDRERNIQKYRYELSWREHYYHLLATTPTLLTENYKSLPNEIAWENDPEQFQAWKAGETGYPLVDAGMRQLAEEGYIHNRPRQNVASFLTKHLLIDWRYGARYFASQLIDHDPAANYGNWQWIASTGTDSVDVRIFDPVAQMGKYDGDATFVKNYVPELQDVPARKVVDWPTLSAAERKQLAPDYPGPIVDRNDAYERAQRVFNRAYGKA